MRQRMVSISLLQRSISTHVGLTVKTNFDRFLQNFKQRLIVEEYIATINNRLKFTL